MLVVMGSLVGSQVIKGYIEVIIFHLNANHTKSEALRPREVLASISL